MKEVVEVPDQDKSYNIWTQRDVVWILTTSKRRDISQGSADDFWS